MIKQQQPKNPTLTQPSWTFRVASSFNLWINSLLPIKKIAESVNRFWSFQANFKLKKKIVCSNLPFHSCHYIASAAKVQGGQP